MNIIIITMLVGLLFYISTGWIIEFNAAHKRAEKECMEYNKIYCNEINYSCYVV